MANPHGPQNNSSEQEYELRVRHSGINIGMFLKRKQEDCRGLSEGFLVYS
jgi:hypothetical protein